MLKPMLVRLAVLCAIAAPLPAQVALSPSQIDPTKMAALMKNSQRAQKPASFALSHKSELTLTDKQVEQLTVLARAEDDSAVVRDFRRQARMSQIMEKRQAGNSEPVTGWNSPVNETLVRDEACEQSQVAAEVLLNLYRDRFAAGKFLTGKQIDLLVELEMSDLGRILRPSTP